MKIIRSKDNPTYKLALKLTKRKFRDDTGLYLLEGVKPLEDAISEGIRIEEIFVHEDIEDVSGFSDNKVIILDKRLFGELADTKSSQGVIAMVQQQLSGEDRLRDLVNGHGNLIVLDRIQDPGNMGTIIRTAEAAGFEGVILINGCVDPYSPKVVRSAAGSLFRIPVIQKVDEDKFIDMSKSSDRQVIVTALEDAKDYRDITNKNRIAIVIGNEGQGVSDKFVKSADLRIKIPMAGAIESLNAAVAAGILMYESQK